ncbi:MAG: hypothetical protein RL701_1735, partial [Pseudomonadota bacterium]
MVCLVRGLAMIVAMGWVSSAQAYSDPAQFAQPVLEAGGGGRFYTGSLAEGYSCDSCHHGAQAPNIVVSGLPQRYVPRATYELQVGWQATLEHAAATLELTDALGQGAGSLALPQIDQYTHEEQCTPVGQGILAAQLYAADDQRTIAAAPDCGASALRVQWTAPERSLGPIWLSVAVLSSNHDGDFTGDGVTQWAQPIPAFGGSVPDSLLTAGCRVAAGSTDETLTPCAWLCAALWLYRRRRRYRRAAPLWLACLCACSPQLTAADGARVDVAFGSAVARWDAGESESAAGGEAYTAGRASTPDAAGVPRDTDNDAGADDTDAGHAAEAAAKPTLLAFNVTTVEQGGEYQPKNIGAIWIEDERGAWVKTLAVWAAVRQQYLYEYAAANATRNK